MVKILVAAPLPHVTSFILVDVYQTFAATSCFHPQDGKTRKQVPPQRLQDCTALHNRRH